MRKRLSLLMAIMVALLLVGAVAFSATNNHAVAGPEIIGNPDHADLRAIVDGGSGYQRIVYFAAGAKTPVGANTPVASNMFCGLGEYEVFGAQVQFTGTMSGTAPTLAIKWQNSVDGGKTWSDVGTWTTINATVTPATQNQQVSEVYNNTTAVAYGDCWRATWTMGGTTPGGSFSMYGLAE